MRRVELGQPVAGGSREAVRDLRERFRGVQRDRDRLGVVAVRGVRRRHRVGRDEHVVTGRGVDRSGVGAAVATPAAAVAVDGGIEAHVEPVAARRTDERLERRAHEDGVPPRIGDEVGHEPVLAALRRRRDAAGHPAPIQRGDGVRHVACLEIGERRAVGDDVLERFDVRVVGGRVVDVAQDAVRDRVPGLGRPVAGRAETVLARQVEVRECSRAVRRGRCGSGRARGKEADGEQRRQPRPCASTQELTHSSPILQPERMPHKGQWSTVCASSGEGGVSCA